MANERAPGVNGQLQKSGSELSLQNAEGSRGSLGTGANSENTLFNKHFNKELKLCEDEIPMVLCELNESALAYLNRDQFDNALLLLQKAHGVLDVVDLSGCSRDQNIALQLFHNMAMCYQKQGQLEECALCLETTLDHLGTDYASIKNQSFGMRIFKIKLEAKLRLQFCAILSQLHRHKEALEQAQEGIKLSHFIIRDSISICRYYSKRIDLQTQFGDLFSKSPHNESNQVSEHINLKNVQRANSKSKKMEYNQLNQKKSDRSNLEDLSRQSQEDFDSDDKISDSSVGQYQTKQTYLNNMDQQISLNEKISKKLLPIYQEVLRKISQIEKRKPFNNYAKPKEEDKTEYVNFDSSDIDSNRIGVANQSETIPAKKKQNKQKKDNFLKAFDVDMRHILGFLNQTEWIQNLNIGNIMQISPLKLEDLLQIRRNDEVLSRENFLEIISFLIVGYFCASTEIRFIIQLKDEIPKFENFQIDKKNQESEFWHTISLEIACSFLPSDCPLLNHILLSYQKHHAPSQTTIPENSSLDEKLRIVKPLFGIENSKFQPIIRELNDVNIDLPLSKIYPAGMAVSKMLKDLFITHQSIEDKQQNLQGVQNSFVQQQSQNNKPPHKKLKNFQVAKLIKLEKLIKQVSKELGMDKNKMMQMLLGEQINNKKNENNTYTVQSSQIIPGDFKSNPISYRQGQQIPNTAIASKVAYNNIKSQITSQTPDVDWKISPQNYMQSRNGKDLSNNGSALGSEIDPKKQSHDLPLSHQIKSQIQSGLIHNDKSRIYDSDSSQRELSFINDLSQANIIHEKSFSEKLDHNTKFVMSNDSNQSAQHHNMSIGAIVVGAAQSQGGTVRQSSKRINSQERGKLQRPRSSKGYRGNQIIQSIQPAGSSHVGSINMQHHMSANHLQSAVGMNSLQNNNMNQNNQVIQKLQMSKSEERNLKSQQNQRPATNKNPRQKTATVLNNNIISHTSSNFNKDTSTGVLNSKASALVSLNSHLQSQSSTQLPSAQATQSATNQKLKKKSIQQIQQTSQQQSVQQIPQTNLAAYNSHNNSLNALNKNKLKLNYEDLKKFLLKEYTAAQAQQILQQHVANSQNSLLQFNTAEVNTSNIQSNYKSQQTKNSGKSNKQGQNTNDTSFMAQDISAFSSQNFMDNANSDLNPVVADHHHTTGSATAVGNPHLSSQQKKAKQILAQARKTSANNNQNNQLIQNMNQPINNLANGPNLIQSQSQLQQSNVQQQYINSMQTSMSANPKQQSQSSTPIQVNISAIKSTKLQNQQQFNSKSSVISSNNKQQNEIMREQNSKSALGTKSSQSLIGPANNSNNIANINNGGGNNLKRREKGRLIMQDWLLKSGQNGQQLQSNTQSQQQFIGLDQPILHQSMISQQATNNSKYLQQINTNSSVSQLQLQQQVSSQHNTRPQIAPQHISHKSHGDSGDFNGSINEINGKPFTSYEARRKSQPI